MKNKLLLFCICIATVFTSCKDEDEAPRPVANFDFTACEAPCTVNFINISQNATSYNWNFGDNTTSTEVNPKHLYENAGTYNVTLQASGEGGTHTREKQVVISPPVFHLKYKVNGVSVEAEEFIINRNIPNGFMAINGVITPTTPPFFSFSIAEPIDGFASGNVISLNLSNPQMYATYVDTLYNSYSTTNDSTGVTLILDYINYINGGMISAKFSGSLKTQNGDLVNVSEGSLKMEFKN